DHTINNNLNGPIKDVVIDDTGRYWFATEWGLNVFDGANWHSFQMSDAPLVKNEITEIKVFGSGPLLPTNTGRNHQ
ncbi:MAG: hypothetical protein AAGD96_13060, partial [Chloroflexota bacterium]